MHKNLFAFLLAGTAVFASVASVSAFGGGEMRGPNSEFHTAMQQAIENDDYAAWKQAQTDQNNQMLSEMTEEKFEKMVEMHQARQSGDAEKAQALAKELGMGKPDAKENSRGMMRGGQRGGMAFNGLNNYGSYAEWKNAMESKGFTQLTENVTEDDFDMVKELQTKLEELREKIGSVKAKTQSQAQ